MITCRLIEIETIEIPHQCDTPGCTYKRHLNKATRQKPQPGDMFFAPWLLSEPAESWAPRYLALPEPRRAPLVVITPDGRWWCLDQREYDHTRGGWHGEGWAMSGEPPLITMSPSINMVGSYHGWLQNGVLTADCEGRHFPA